MHNLPKTGNIHLLAALGLLAFDAMGAGVRAFRDRKKYQELLSEYQRLNGLSEAEMALYRPSFEDLAESGPMELQSPLRTRLTTPGCDAVYHIASRLCGDLPLLEGEHRERFRDMLGRVAGYCGIGVLNFTIMDNHFHLLVKVPKRDGRLGLGKAELLERIALLHPELSVLLREALLPENAETETAVRAASSAMEHFGIRLMQGKTAVSPQDSAADWAQRELERHRGLMCELEMFVRLLKQRFSKWYNLTHDRFGTLWADRFRSMLIEDRPEVLQAISAYIDLNSVRRGWVDDPTKYEHCGLAEAVRGAGAAREGMTKILSEDSGEAAVWADLMMRHREMLWGTGSGEREHTLGLAHFFLRPQEALLQGQALGSSSFVENVFRSNRGAFGGNGTWRGDELILRSGVKKRWIVAGLYVLQNVRFEGS
jgi:putative transposase